MFWDIVTIVLILAVLFIGREVRIFSARLRLEKWRRFSFR